MSVPFGETRQLQHLVTDRVWRECRDDMHYRPPSLLTEGFVHLSAPDQVAGTVARFYADVEDLLLVTVDADALGPALVWEDLLGHGRYPHCYGPIPLTAVAAVTPYGQREEPSGHCL